jgi:hypothetical protein
MSKMGTAIGGGTAGVDIKPPAIKCPHGQVVRWRDDKDDREWQHRPCADCQQLFLKTCNCCPEKDTIIGRMVGTRCDSCPHEFLKSLFGPTYETGLSKWIYPFDPRVTYGLPFPEERGVVDDRRRRNCPSARRRTSTGRDGPSLPSGVKVTCLGNR